MLSRTLTSFVKSAITAPNQTKIFPFRKVFQGNKQKRTFLSDFRKRATYELEEETRKPPVSLLFLPLVIGSFVLSAYSYWESFRYNVPDGDDIREEVLEEWKRKKQTEGSATLPSH